MTAFPWSQLITALATLSAVALTWLLGTRSRSRDQRLATYARLIEAAGDVLDTHRQMLPPPAAMNEAAAADFNRRIDAALSEVRRAVAAVELTGSAPARAAATRLRLAALGQAGTRVTRHTDHTGKEDWVFEVHGAGDEFFEDEISVFIEMARREVTRRRRGRSAIE